MIAPELLTKQLSESLRDNLVSVVLFGSSAIEDTTKKFSDINILVVVKNADMATLRSVTPFVGRWCKQGNPAPLFLSMSTWEKGKDVFAIEFTDIQAAHRILFGTDLFTTFQADPAALRHQLESELRSKQLLLKKGYLECAGNDKELQQLIAKSYSSFTVLIKTILRLMGLPAPLKKAAAWNTLADHLSVDLEVIDLISQLRDGKKLPAQFNTHELFEKYLNLIGRVVDYVDKFEVKK
ncbi:MAG: hypothetical protein KCHDKBKB_02347 [Elusimicrobia bacterium]|nr:hypothetical protein [Elusimicrobiota bacterium]